MVSLFLYILVVNERSHWTDEKYFFFEEPEKRSQSSLPSKPARASTAQRRSRGKSKVKAGTVNTQWVSEGMHTIDTHLILLLPLYPTWIFKWMKLGL